MAGATLLQGCNEQSRPNVLFISVDDLNDWIGPLKGHPQARTPNLDRLLAEGVSFTNAHCTAPVCAASRNSLLTGLKPSTTGWYTNAKYNNDQAADEVLGDTPTLPQHFRQNGYSTMAAGKIFHTGTSDYRKEQWNEVLPHYVIKDEALHRRGFGYGNDKDHKYYPFPRDGGQIVQHFGPDTPGKSLCWGALERSDIPMNGVMPDEYIANWASEKLSARYDNPFFLAVGFIRPHVPYTAPKEYFDMFPLDEIIMPEIIEDEMEDIPLYGKAMALGVIPGGDHNAVLEIGGTFWKELVRANLACIAFADAQVGKVLDALEKSPYKENTITVLWSDHGQNFGEHCNWRKMCLWEESTRVPLIIRTPGRRQGAVCNEAVSLLDLYPTLTELSGIPAVASNEGLALTGLLKNPGSKREQPAVTTWGYRNHSVRDERWRYIQYRDGTEELYDHAVDDEEHYNLAGQKQYQEIIDTLKQWIPQQNRLPYGQDSYEDDFLEQRIKKWKTEGLI